MDSGTIQPPQATLDSLTFNDTRPIELHEAGISSVAAKEWEAVDTYLSQYHTYREQTIEDVTQSGKQVMIANLQGEYRALDTPTGRFLKFGWNTHAVRESQDIVSVGIDGLHEDAVGAVSVQQVDQALADGQTGYYKLDKITENGHRILKASERHKYKEVSGVLGNFVYFDDEVGDIISDVGLGAQGLLGVVSLATLLWTGIKSNSYISQHIK